ncbi:MAG: peptidoglycan-associated lipoprotein Pal [Pseudomonadota bacterium]
MIRYLLLITFLVMTGCATTGDDANKDGTAVEDRTADGTENQDGKTSGYQEGSGVDGSALSDAERYSMKALNDPNSPLSIRTIYFSYDSSEVSAESQDVLMEHARFLSLNPTVQVVLEGHTDERGTRDYNLALGEGRSKSVHEFFTAQGVDMTQLEVVSFGEERPVAQEHDEAAWQLNRRVEILYP